MTGAQLMSFWLAFIEAGKQKNKKVKLKIDCFFVFLLF